MLRNYFNQLFWDVYGAWAWDELPSKNEVVNTVVDIVEETRVVPHGKILDAGCGTGNYAFALSERGYCVTGIDLSSGMLERAKSKMTAAHDGRLAFERMDMNGPLAFPDDQFDHVLSMTSLWTVADPRYTLSELVRVTKPGGTLIVMQIPKPTRSLAKVISTRTKNSKSGSIIVKALMLAKAVLERTRLTKYWTPEELLALLLGTKCLNISYIDHGPPIIVVAAKTKPFEPGA